MKTQIHPTVIYAVTFFILLVPQIAGAHTGEVDTGMLISLWHNLSHGTQAASTATHFAFIPASLAAGLVLAIATLLLHYFKRNQRRRFLIWVCSSSIATFGLVGYLA